MEFELTQNMLNIYKEVRLSDLSLNKDFIICSEITIDYNVIADRNITIKDNGCLICKKFICGCLFHKGDCKVVIETCGMIKCKDFETLYNLDFKNHGIIDCLTMTYKTTNGSLINYNDGIIVTKS